MGRRPRFTLFPIAHSPGRRLHQAHSRLRQGLTQLLREAGYEITTESWAVLSHLWETDGPTQFELGERLEKDRHNTSRLVDSLEEQGLVRRRASRRDRRIREVALTEKGRAAQKPLTRIVSRFLEDTFAGVSDQALDGFLRTLDHIILHLDTRACYVAPQPAAMSSRPPAPRPVGRRKQEV